MWAAHSPGGAVALKQTPLQRDSRLDLCALRELLILKHMRHSNIAQLRWVGGLATDSSRIG